MTWITLDEIYGAVFYFFTYLFLNYFLIRSPATSLVWENAAFLFCCEAPEMFLVPQNFNLMFHQRGGEEIVVGCSFKDLMLRFQKLLIE